MAKSKMIQTMNPQSTFQIRQRGCGWPIAGGTYMYVPTGFNGIPIWNFVIDPTVQIVDPFSFGLSAIGMCLKSSGMTNAEGKEIFDLWDWIGASAYPNPTDWFLEVQQLGFHQKVSPELLKGLVPESQYYAVHSAASFEDPTIAYDTRMEHPNYPICPTNIESHIKLPDGDKLHLFTCPGLFFSNLVQGTQADKDSRVVVREMPAFSYDGFCPTGNEGRHVPAAFFRIPIGRMVRFLVYEDVATKTHEKALKALEALDEKLKRVSLISLDGGPK
jgi:hypothetical protein